MCTVCIIFRRLCGATRVGAQSFKPVHSISYINYFFCIKSFLLRPDRMGRQARSLPVYVDGGGFATAFVLCIAPGSHCERARPANGPRPRRSAISDTPNQGR